MYCVDSSLNGSEKQIMHQVWRGFQSSLFAYVHIYAYIYKFVCVHVWVCIHIRVFVCVQMYIDMCGVYKKLLGPIPNNHILLLKNLANLSGSLHSDKKLS